MVQFDDGSKGILEYLDLDYTTDQLHVLNGIENDINIIDLDNLNRNNEEIVLSGYAGTGKTTILENIFRYAFDSGKYSEVMILTPTNKARVVLEEKLTIHKANFSTLHAFIYGSPDETGKWIAGKNSVSKAFIIVEEASMLNSDVKKDLLATCSSSIILFVGDGFQLEPIGKNPEIFKNPKYELTEVKRNTNEVLKLSMAIRKSNLALIPKKSSEFVKVASYDVCLEYYMKALKEKKDIIFLVSTNSVRLKINKACRLELFGEESNVVPLYKGEKLISIANSNTLSNGEIISVDKLEIISGVQKFYLKDYYKKTWTLDVVLCRVNGSYTLLLPNVDKPSLYHQQISSGMDYGTLVRIVGDKNIEYNKGGKPVLSRNVNILTYSYAISTHKSQGSQFDEVIVYQNYMAATWNKARWLYTAVTRTIKKVILIKTSYNIYKENDEHQ